MNAKEKHRQRLLNYLSDPENEFPTRTQMAREILRLTISTFYKHFTPEELDNLENEAFENRKKRSARKRAELYCALHREGVKGNIPAAKEFLDRTEGKVTEKRELTGKDGERLIGVPGISLLLETLEQSVGKDCVEDFKKKLINGTKP